MAEAFVLEVASASAELARHRQSRAITPKDIQLYLGIYDLLFIFYLLLYTKLNA